MKKLILLLLLIPSLAWGQVSTSGVSLSGCSSGGASAACTPSTGACTSATAGECGTTYLHCEDLEGSVDCNVVAGELNFCRATYTAVDSYGQYNYSGTGKIEGNYSYNNQASTWPSEKLKTFTATSPMYAFFKIYVARDADDVANYAFCFPSDSGTKAALLIFTGEADGTGYTIGAGGCGTSDYGTKLSYDTTYNVWMEYTMGTGANAKLDVYVSSTSTKGSVYANYADGNCTGGAEGFWIGSGFAQNSINITSDHFRVSSTQMTGVPD